ncbi:MAG: UPF0280 family protein [Candidatus Omnitrophica bacterium]|nr:UPF0280 family protein [Candidatus Omnitrophota bacterium]
MKYEERTYRDWVGCDDLVGFQAVVGETDLSIFAESALKQLAIESIKRYRGEIEDYIKFDPQFKDSLVPIDLNRPAPEIVEEMVIASKKAGVGPMAAIAGAVAEFVGRDLLKRSDQIIVENGGDIFIKVSRERKLGVFAGESPLSGKISFKITPDMTPCGICASSGTVGHSLSFGKADAAIIFAKDAIFADAVATATGNVVKCSDDIEKGIEFAKSIEGVFGVCIIVGERIGNWGKIELI